MSHRTAATALLLASLPYGLALPQAIPLINDIAPPAVTPLTFPFAPVIDAPIVTVIGTPEPAVKTAIENAPNVGGDVAETVDLTPLEPVTSIIPEASSAAALPTLDLEANILPLILPKEPTSIPINTPNVPSDLPDTNSLEVIDLPAPTDAPSDLPDTNSLEVIDLPAPTDAPSDLPDTNSLEVIDLPAPTDAPSDLPDTNDLEVIDLPPPSELPGGDDTVIVDPFDPILTDPVPFPLPSFGPEATVPIGTFNGVVRPLLSVIQVLIDSLPGNVIPQLPEIFIHPVFPPRFGGVRPKLPTVTPDIFINPILPTEAPEIFIDPLSPTETLLPSIDTVAISSDVADLPVDPVTLNKRGPLQKRQSELSAESILNLIRPILELIKSLLDQIPVGAPSVDSTASEVEGIVPVDVPSLPVAIPAVSLPAVPVPDVTVPTLPVVSLPNVPVEIPALPLPTIPSSPEQPPIDEPELPTDAPADLFPLPTPTIAVPEVALPTSELPTDVSFIIPGVPDFSTEVPFPTELPDGIDDVPIDVPAILVPAVPGQNVSLPVVSLPTELPIEAPGLPDAPVVVAPTLAVPDISLPTVSLPTDLDVPELPTEVPAILVPDVSELPEEIPPILNGDVPLPDLPPSLPTALPVEEPTLPAIAPALPPSDLPIAVLPPSSLPVPVPDVPVDTRDPAIPLDVWSIPVPDLDGLDFSDDLPAPVVSNLPAPEAPEWQIPDDVLNVPIPDFDENGLPIDTPVEPITGLPSAPAALPGLLDWPFDDWEIPDVPDSATGLPPSDLPTLPAPVTIPAVPTVTDIPIPENVLTVPAPDLGPAPALPVEAFGAGFPVDLSPDLPLVLPGVPDLPTAPVVLPPVPTPEVPVIPAPVVPVIPVPAVPAPAGPSVPTVPVSAPAVPAPEVPAVPAVPVVPAIPALPLPAPQVPAVPVAPAVPVLPAIPTVPAVPAVPAPAPAVPAPAFPVFPPIAIQPVPTVFPSFAPVTPPVVPALPVVPGVPAVPTPPTAPVVPRPAIGGIAPVVPKLPFQVRGAGFSEKREMMAPVVPTPDLPLDATTIAIALIKPLFSLVSALIAKLPLFGEISPDLGASLPDIANILTGLPGLPAVDIGLPPLGGGIASIPDAGSAVSTVGDAVPKVPVAFGSGLAKRQLDARTSEMIANGAAADWESFLGELDESTREELHGLIEHSATALNTHSMDNLASKLQDDFEVMSDETQSKLLSSWTPGSVLTTENLEKRMRHGKRSSNMMTDGEIPGVQSIGANLDDALKVDLSSILGPSGTLDPNNQLNTNLPAENLPGRYNSPSHIPYQSLADSSTDTTIGPALSDILGNAGTLDPNGMLDPESAHLGKPVDSATNPFLGRARPAWTNALDANKADSLPGLEATIQAARNNNVRQKAPTLPFQKPHFRGISHAMRQATDGGQVLSWFRRFVRPSWRSDVDATILE